jgi:hypothetical protein
MVTIHLINTFCRPLLLYGCDDVSLCPSHVDSLAHSFNHIYWRLFKVNNIHCIKRLSQLQFELIPSQLRFDMRSIREKNERVQFFSILKSNRARNDLQFENPVTIAIRYALDSRTLSQLRSELDSSIR